MSKKRKMVLFLEYEPCAECKNPDVMYLCHHCGRCGRKFEGGHMYKFGSVSTG